MNYAWKFSCHIWSAKYIEYNIHIINNHINDYIRVDLYTVWSYIMQTPQEKNNHRSSLCISPNTLEQKKTG